MPVREISNDTLNAELISAGDKLVMVDFFATWCGPCKNIAPHIDQLSSQYPNAVFLKADVEKCTNEALKYSIKAMPTFVFFQHGKEVARLQGASKDPIEQTIKKFYKDTPTKDIGYTDLKPFIEEKSCTALNEIDKWQNALLDNQPGMFRSDEDDPELILHIAFNQVVKIHSIAIEAPEENGPKTVKLFINRHAIDFNDAKSSEAVQTLQFEAKHLKDGLPVELRFVKFQSVQSIALFFANNQSDSDQTAIKSVTFYGTPIVTTNMKDFKKAEGMPVANT
ncbi:unnamed protein product [Rotaria magnacalcarata]|uniref:Thioredoxin-like protein 1 n=3 Tax=Rotaria magnacalcarata TaxID=392030 RepID=A0A819V539_9BILA|nr:unnamed protein product [Rotaria magnacalcarata]CAF2025627.1 unnamed protein product [Rotaria magnacalcarata]CAF2091580.1 unnamed protein product [Rotaria magnacalcarata]CAF2094842.1 unnamed protein product [Rotaria magnacalcarata]CAF3843962.1 unnamed protein product [Rotaria magnacalcarata]